MSGQPKLVLSEIQQLRQEGLTLQEIAERFQVSRAAVSLRLKRQSSRQNQVRPEIHCQCGCGLLTKKKYASQSCYYKAVTEGREYLPWRHGQRIAREKVQAVFPLLRGYVVHHVDGNNHNNKFSNLWVFSSNSDHLSFHRGGFGEPIWCGIANC